MPSVEQIRTLREQTGAGMMDCKKALVECGDDRVKAANWLREEGITKAAAKSGRIAVDGLVAVATDGDTAALVEVNCETDFVAKNALFVAFAEKAAALVAKNQPKDAAQALDLDADGGKLGDSLTDLVAKLGENIRLRRVMSLKGEFQTFYIHNQVGEQQGGQGGVGSIATVVNMDKKAPEVAEGVAMHIAAFAPLAISKEDVDKALVEKERAILAAQAEKDGNRPPEIIAKMIEGRLGKWFKEVVLLEQGYVMDDKKSVGKVLTEVGAKVVSFVRWQVGEGDC